MRILGIDVAFYHVNDMAASAAWYRDILGLEQVADYGDWREFTVGGARFGLDAGNAATEIPNAVVSFQVDDLDEAVNELSRRGITPASEIVDAGPIRFVALLDPSGNVVQLSQPKSQ
jgi:lactoylglutathione lyase